MLHKKERLTSIGPYFGESFDGYYCINLDRRISRWLSVKHVFDRVGIPIERISAIDESYVEDLFGKQEGPKFAITKAEYAILQSHKLCWLKARSEGKQRIAVFEDDILFIKRFQEEWLDIYEHIPPSFDFLTLGTFLHDPFSDRLSERIYKCGLWLGLFAYVIDLSIVDRLLPLLTGFKQVDAVIGSLAYCGNHYAVEPPLVGNYRGWSDNTKTILRRDGDV